MARIVDPHCDVLLVGDSLGMVVHGLPSTLGVTLEMMILHGRAVMRGSSHALVVIDMPFGSYEEGPEQAFRSAARVMVETGAAAVKLEGGVHMAETIAFLVARGIPVMAHVGLTPQAVNMFGGYKVQGRAEDAARVMRRCRGRLAGGRILGRDRESAGRAGARHHRRDRDTDNRHRRLGSLRRAGAGGG